MVKLRDKLGGKLWGIAELPLHYGKMPKWLYNSMVELAKEISKIIVFEYGRNEMLQRLSNPFWFQAFGCVLGFDWHSSGLTTTVTAAMKEAFTKANIGLYVAGGKGKTSKKTPEHIEKYGEKINLSENKIDFLKKTSRIIAKTDNAVLQDSYELYHHVIVFDENTRYAVIQQGMNEFSNYARRYHWLYEDVKQKGFFNDSHAGIITAFKLPRIIDLSSAKSKDAREKCVDLAKENPSTLKREITGLQKKQFQKSLFEWMEKNEEEIEKKAEIDIRKNEEQKKEKIKKLIMQSEHEILKMPKIINWDALRMAYEKNPKSFEELIEIKGMGKANIRALSLLSSLIYGKEISWNDPASYSFAHGGKDGIPYPINKLRYEKSIQILHDAIKNAEINKKEKLYALRRLKDFLE